MSKSQTIIRGPQSFDKGQHCIYSLNSGSDFIEDLITGRAGKNYGDDYAEFVFTTPRNIKLQEHVIAYACGSIVRDDVPRIELELLAVDQDFQRMGLGSAIANQLISTLYARASLPVIEVRAVDVVQGDASNMWHSRGFKTICGTDHMAKRITADNIGELHNWQPRLRPDMQLAVAKHAQLIIT